MDLCLKIDEVRPLGLIPRSLQGAVLGPQTPQGAGRGLCGRGSRGAGQGTGSQGHGAGLRGQREIAIWLYCQELLGHKTGGRGRAGRAASPPPRGGVWPGRQRAGVRQMPPGRAGETKAPRGAGAGGPGVRPFLQQPLPSLESWAPLAQPLVATTRASECQAWVGGASGTRGWRQKASEQRRSRGPGAGARRAPPASLPPTPAVPQVSDGSSEMASLSPALDRQGPRRARGPPRVPGQQDGAGDGLWCPGSDPGIPSSPLDNLGPALPLWASVSSAVCGARELKGTGCVACQAYAWAAALGRLTPGPAGI